MKIRLPHLTTGVAWLLPAGLAFWLGLSKPVEQTRIPDRGKAAHAAAALSAKVTSVRPAATAPDTTATGKPDGAFMSRLRAVLDEPVTLARRRAWLFALEKAGPAELAAAAELLASLQDPIRGDWLPYVLADRWLAVDPDAFLRYVREHPKCSMAHESFLCAAAEILGKSNPEAAKALRQQSPDELPNAVLQGIAGGTSPAEMETMAEWLLAAPDSEGRPMLYNLVHGVCRSTGTEGADRLLDTLRRRSDLPPEKLTEAVRMAASDLGKTAAPDIPAAVAWIRRQETMPGWQANNLQVFFDSLANSREPAVIEMVEQLGPDPATGSWPHAASAVAALTRARPGETALWLDAHPDSPFYDQAAQAWTDAVMSGSVPGIYAGLSPAQATAVIARITDPALKRQVRLAYGQRNP